MKSLTEAINDCAKNKSKALIPFLTSGYPDRNLFLRLMKEFLKSGADIIEVGIPFSDPMADGKSIQFSSQKALENGVTIGKTFDYLSTLQNGRNVPVVIMSYLNPILSYGLLPFIKDAAACGVRGLIIPDLTPDEGNNIEPLCNHGNIDLIYLLAPTSNSARRKLILNRTHGFVYLVAVAGVTGVRQTLPANLSNWIAKVKHESRLPVCVGFGISNARQASIISRRADGIIVGSAIIEIIRQSKTSGQIVANVGRFIRQIRKELNNV